MISKMFYAILLCCSVAVVQAAADEPKADKVVVDEFVVVLDEVVKSQNPPAVKSTNDLVEDPITFEKVFKIGTLNSKTADLILWNATTTPQHQINIHIVSGHPNFIKCIKQTAATLKVEAGAEQKLPTIEKLIDAAGKEYTSGLPSKVYAKRVAHIQKIMEMNGVANIEENTFVSCPKTVDRAIGIMTKYPVRKDKKDKEDKEDKKESPEEFPIEHFEYLLKEDLYEGPYVIVEKEKSRAFLAALESSVETGKEYETKWVAVEFPQKSLLQQAWDFVTN